MKILVIDDSKEDRDLILTHIKKMNKNGDIQIEECNCLKNAIDKLSLSSYDIIILDLILPETDGIETVKKITDHLEKINKNIPIVILTGVEDYSIGRQAWSLGIKDYLIKGEIQTQDLSRALKFASYNNDNIMKKSVWTA